MPASARPQDIAAHNQAARSIGRRVTFLGHALLWSIGSVGVLAIAGVLPGLIVTFAWGAGLAAHGFFAVLGPELRQRWTEAELARIPGRLAQERRDVESRHARSLEQLSASIAHEIRNPITAAKSLVQQIRDDPAATENAEYARIALEEIDRVERAVSHLLRFAREEETKQEDVDLAQVIDAALSGLSERVAGAKVQIERDVDAGAKLRGDADKLRRVVINLVSNALDALGEGNARAPRVRVSAGRSLAGSEVWLRVADNGPGIEASRLPDIWNPFHTTKDGGTGLGLAIVRKIVEAHGGSIDVTSEVGRGTEMIAIFPAAEQGYPVKPRVLVVDDEPAIRVALKGLLDKQGYDVVLAAGGDEAIEAIAREPCDLVLVNLALGRGKSGLDVLAASRAAHPGTPVILMTAYGSEKVAVEAMKAGAHDYVPKPFDNDEMRMVVERALERTRLEREHRLLLDRVAREHGLGAMIGASPAMRRVFETIHKVAETDLTVLVSGESGTGKELVAQALHERSARRTRPFVAVNCAAMSRDLVESELFGHEKGAFTGAGARRAGRFESADGGTLLLDEIGDMPRETQAKVLRVLQERAFERVGGTTTLHVDVRVVAATNRDLEAEVRSGAFREDLYYRLRVVEIELPPLRERPEDIPALVERFLSEVAARLGRPRASMTAPAMAALASHRWPGNVRELRNLIERAVVLASGTAVDVSDLALDAGKPTAAIGTFAEAKRRAMEDFERSYLRAALERHGGNVSRTAEAVGMVRQSLQQKMRELGLRGV